jgi:hypothetical protein
VPVELRGRELGEVRDVCRGSCGDVY